MKITLPEQRDRKWLILVGYIFLANLSLFLLSRFVLGSEVSGQNFIAFTILSLVISLTLFTGYFGFRIWVTTILISMVIAHSYLLYASIFNIADGWTDLASFIGALMHLILGFVGGAVIELVVYLYKRLSKKSTR